MVASGQGTAFQRVSRPTTSSSSQVYDYAYLCQSGTSITPTRFAARIVTDFDDEWSARLEIVSGHYTGYMLTHTDGWLYATSREVHWRFVDKDSHYEIWDGKDKKRPVHIVQGSEGIKYASSCLRADAAAKPEAFNLRRF